MFIKQQQQNIYVMGNICIQLKKIFSMNFNCKIKECKISNVNNKIYFPFIYMPMVQNKLTSYKYATKLKLLRNIYKY